MIEIKTYIDDMDEKKIFQIHIEILQIFRIKPWNNDYPNTILSKVNDFFNA
jgi:hypothetical protein